MVGTSLFLPSTTPASNHPLSTTSICSPCLRSTVGPPQPAASRRVARTPNKPRAEAGGRMPVILLEHSHLDPLQGLFPRDLPRQELGQIRAPHADDERPGVAVG